MVEAIVYALFLFVLALALHATASLTLLAAACLFLSAAAANKRNKPKEKKSLPCSGLTGEPDDKAAFAGFDFDKPETGEDDEPSNFLKPDTLLPVGFLESEEVLPRRNTGREVPPLYEDGEQKRSRAYRRNRGRKPIGGGAARDGFGSPRGSETTGKIENVAEKKRQIRKELPTKVDSSRQSFAFGVISRLRPEARRILLLRCGRG